MGKTPKKAAPGGDERNLYVRRLKATTAPSRASEFERQRESESTNRPKLTGVQKKLSAGSGKNFKSKLRNPVKVGSYQAAKQLKPSIKIPGTKATDMQTEAEEAEVKLNVSIQKENVKAEDNIDKNEESVIDKECDISEQTSSQFQIETAQEIIFVDDKIIPEEKEGTPLQNFANTTKEVEEQEEGEIKLTFESDTPIKQGEEKLDDKRSKDGSKERELPVAQDEFKNGIIEKEEIQSEPRVDNESCSVDIVESTTSEIIEIPESVTQSDTQKDKEKLDNIVNNDISFVSYDSSIMLKDVQIRLNDCLKDNSNLFDVSNVETTPSQLVKDMSFGKTLRNISGRNSISRMRHVTLREKRISPNSSLYVNTSTLSIPQDEGTECKILHYTSGLSESYSTNGSPLDRKRKIEAATWGSAKELKMDAESSLLNTSVGFLKGLRKPIQVSTPNITPYKFESAKLDISGLTDDDNKIMAEANESTKKWCVIM